MNTNPMIMTGALFLLLPLITVSVMVQASSIEDAATFGQSVTGSGIATKSVAIQALTENGEIDTSYTSSEFNEKFADCGTGLPGVNGDMKVRTSKNGCELQNARNGTIRIGVQVVENGEISNEKVLIGYE